MLAPAEGRCPGLSPGPIHAVAVGRHREEDGFLCVDREVIDVEAVPKSERPQPRWIRTNAAAIDWVWHGFVPSGSSSIREWTSRPHLHRFAE
jgi:hypothetical protein